MSTFDDFIVRVLSHEGGYVNDQRDPGGETKFGIAQSAAAAPTVGDWQRGDMLYNSAVTTAGQGLFVCTAPGTPGTWGFN